MKINNMVLVLMVSVFFSCACTKKSTVQEKDDVFTYWVSGSKEPCQGMVPMECMMVKKGADFEKHEWTYFYDAIDGFNYTPGFTYKLRVKEEHIPIDQVPADASSIRYTLVELLEKNIDMKGVYATGLHDIWALEKLGNVAVSKKNTRQPDIEINLTKNKFYGNDGCNNIMGGIKLVDSRRLEFGGVGSTKMACPNMEDSYAFTQGLEKTKTYKIENLKLYLFDANGGLLLQFRKVD